MSAAAEVFRDESPRLDANIWEKTPVALDVFLYDDKYLGQPDLSPIQLDAVRHLETIYHPYDEAMLCELFGWEPVRLVNYGAIEWGKGSGKDTICGIVLARWIYRLLCLKNPVAYYGKAPQTHIHFLNIASSAGQASRAFFTSFRELIKNAPVFEGTYEVVTGDKAKRKGEPGKYEIEFVKHINAISGHSGSASQEGLNLLGAIADEISEFKTKAEVERTIRNTTREPQNTADAVIKLMRTSAITRFPLEFKNAFISYPRAEGDAIKQLIARGNLDIESKGADSKWYVSGPLPTWEVNPTVPNKEVFADDYRPPPLGDPAAAEAMYECNPSRATNRVYRNDAAIAAAFSRPNDPPPVTVAYYWGKDDSPSDERNAPEEVDNWQARYQFNGLYPYVGCLYALHGDMAISGDRAGIAMTHVKNWKAGDWQGAHGTVHEVRPIVTVDFVLALEADLSLAPAREVQLRWFRKLIWTLSARGFPIGWVSMDGWQSEDSLQILASRGIETEKLSCDIASTPVWGTLKDLMYDVRLDAPYDKLLRREIHELRKLPNGKVDHPDGGSKDLADAVAGAVYGSLQVGGAGEGEIAERADQTSIDMFGLAFQTARGLPSELDNVSLDEVDLSPPSPG